MTQTEAEASIRRRRVQLVKHPIKFIGVPIVIMVGLFTWWMVQLFNLGFAPPVPGTTLSTSVTGQIWGQSRRTPQNTGFAPDEAPILPREVLWTFQSSGKSITAPKVSDSHIYLASKDGKAVALNRLTGEIVWEYQSDGPPGSAPAVVGHTVIFGFRGGDVLALNQLTGAVVWKNDTRSPIYAAPRDG